MKGREEEREKGKQGRKKERPRQLSYPGLIKANCN